MKIRMPQSQLGRMQARWAAHALLISSGAVAGELLAGSAQQGLALGGAVSTAVRTTEDVFAAWVTERRGASAAPTERDERGTSR